jgi:fumarate hydratase class II
MIERINALTHLTVRSSGNLFESMQSMADAADFSGAMNTLALTLTRIANDFRLLASGPTTGLDEIRLPAVQPGSSIMPGKVNPVLAEMLNMASYQVMGNHLTVSVAAAAGQLELNVMMPIIAYNLFQEMDILIHAVDAFTRKCVVGITANREKAEGWLAKSAVLVTALNPVIGYLKAAEVSKEAMARNVPIRQVVLEKGYLSPEQLAQILDVRAMTEGGIMGMGGGS